MSQPTLTSHTPASDSVGIVLGQKIEVTFDQAIDSTSVTSATFAVRSPSGSLVFDADDLSKSKKPAAGKVFVQGTISFPSANKIVFTPATPFQQKTTYEVTVLGGTGGLTTAAVKNSSGERLDKTYIWKFTTTDQEIVDPGSVVQSPLPELSPEIPTSEIRVFPASRTLGNGIEIYFPDSIDESSIDPAYFNSNLEPDSNPFNDIQVSLEPVNNDPLVSFPSQLTHTLQVIGNKIIVTFGEPS